MRGPVAARSTSPDDSSSGSSEGARVVSFDRRRRDQGPGPQPPLGSIEQRLAALAESLYLERGRTLTDERTGEAHDIAMGVVLRLMESVHAQADETMTVEDCYRQLLGWVETARRAPGIITGTDPGADASMES